MTPIATSYSIEMKDSLNVIAEAARVIESADALIILAGAGMGVDSGLPDYRGVKGLWREYPHLKELGLSFEEVANPRLFNADPQAAWNFYGHRRKLYRDNTPHAGYTLLQAWSEAMPEGHFAFTSNVDGHFQLAGFDPEKLVECHGNAHYIQCSKSCTELVWQVSADDRDYQQAGEEFPIYYCPECNSVARPNVMMFGDWEWNHDRSVEQQRRYDYWVRSVKEKESRVAIIEIGAGTGLPAVRLETEALLQRLNGRMIRINTREPEASEDSISIGLPALQALQDIDGALSESFKQGLKMKDGGVTSRRPNNLLRFIKASKVYAKPCHVTLSNGWTGSVSRFEMNHVYSGMLEGLPFEGSIDRYVTEAQQYAHENGYGPGTTVIEPTVFDSKSRSPVIPSLRMIATIQCNQSSRADDDGTWLTLIWFAEIDEEKSIKDYVAEAVVQVDWEKEAEGYSI
jgi:NAD-dependent SIR2 family protein deacetylase